ncbi:MAG: hypothetical protein H7222_17775 [Methylotenera sp.]|nr:hypothetical protein [Oligoflexia bacterium]
MPIRKSPLILLLLVQFAALPALSSEEKVASTAAGQVMTKCWDFLKNPRTWFEKAASPIGMVVGGARDIILTVTGVAIFPNAVAQWLPLSNEMANVLSHSTPMKWLYEGLSKKMVDGIAAGSIFSHSIAMGHESGVVVGGLTFAADMGLTYWFPNNYFHKIMHTIPQYLPGDKLKKAGETKVGQGVIGVSMIAVLEQVVHHTELLIQMIPQLFGAIQGPARSLASSEVQRGVELRHALAIFLIEGEFSGGVDEKTVLWLAGADKEGGIFSYRSKLTPVLTVKVDAVTRENFVRCEPLFRQLLSENEMTHLQTRFSELSGTN